MLFQSIFTVAFIVINCNLAFCWPNFHLFTQSNKQNSFLTDATNINSSPFSSAKKTYFVIHGFNSVHNNAWNVNIKDGILSKENVNVFSVDWNVGASGDYNTAVSNAQVCGASIADFIKRSNINLQNTHCIGHSLGAHICGFISKNSGKKLARITGLDPAGPNFKGQPASARLDKSDAIFVDNIHGDFLLGIQDPIGHKDFYPNGGASQAGCGLIGKRRSIEVLYPGTRADLISALSCSHNRIPNLYAESITSSCKFTTTKCTSYADYNSGKCACSTLYGCSSMGHYAFATEEGSYYLTTNGNTPFCKN